MEVKIFETTDVFNKKVALYEEDYKKHILIGHPEMEDVGEIKETVETPNMVYKSKNFENRKIFFKLGANKKYKNVYTKAVVEYNDSEARITTSFLSSDIQGVEEGGLIYAKFNSKLR